MVPPAFLIALAVLVAVVCGVDAASAAPIRVAWDRSPDTAVVGYRVYVGTTSGYYTQTFDAGNVTSFSYEASEQRTYYFAVAAYWAGPVVGPLSGEVAAGSNAAPPQSPSNTTLDSSSYWSFLWTVQPKASRLSQPPICWVPSSKDCVTVHTVARTDAAITSMAATSDGRLFLVEGGRRVRLATSAGMALDPVLVEPDPSVTLGQVAVDPTFAETGFIWISETTTLGNGRREFRILRYRVVKNQAGERASVLPPFALPENGDALFAIDELRRIYVAVPASEAGSEDAYAGNVLRFNADGTTPADQPAGSPLFATGYSVPTGITADFGGNLWLSGVDRQSFPSTGYVDARSDVGHLPLTPLVVMAELRSGLVADSARGGVVSVRRDGLVERTRVTGNGPPDSQALALSSGRVTAVAATPTGDYYAGVQSTGTSGTTFLLVRVSRAR